MEIIRILGHRTPKFFRNAEDSVPYSVFRQSAKLKFEAQRDIMEEKFIAAWLANREKAAKLGVRLRPVAAEEAMKTAHRWLSGHRESDGFAILADKKHLELTLEALAVDKRFTGLFTDEEANNALTRLLNAGYRF